MKGSYRDQSAHRLVRGLESKPIFITTNTLQTPFTTSISTIAAANSRWPQGSLGETIDYLQLCILVLIFTRFDQQVLIDTTPLPDDIPKVKEIGASSAPLMSASFFIGARCKPYNDDYMMCKTESNGRGELECMKEGRKVTRCATSVYDLSESR